MPSKPPCGQRIAVRLAWERVASRLGTNFLRPFLQRGRLLVAHRVCATIRPKSAAVRTGQGRASASATGFTEREGGQHVGELYVHHAQRQYHADGSLQVRVRRCRRAGGPSRLVASGCHRRRSRLRSEIAIRRVCRGGPCALPYRPTSHYPQPRREANWPQKAILWPGPTRPASGPAATWENSADLPRSITCP
jgi:hypothetical protein